MPPWHLAPLAWGSFGGLYLALRKTRSRVQAFARGWWWGMGFFTVGLYWICISLYVEPEKYEWLTPFVLFGFPAILSIYLGIFGLGWHFLRPLCRGWAETGRVLLFTTLWVGVEAARAHLFTGFPWNLLGYGFCFSTALLQPASMVGIYGLSWLYLLLATLPVLIVLRAPEAKQALILGVILFTVMLSFGVGRLHALPTQESTLRVRLVQANIPQLVKWDPKSAMEGLRRYAHLTRQPGIESVQLVIWPETAVPFSLEQGSPLLKDLGALLPERALLITGALRREGPWRQGHIWNSLFTLDAKGSIVASYDKHHLVPFGEFMPLRPYWPVERIVGDVLDISSGPGPMTLLIPPYPPVSPLICYEAIFPDQATDGSGRPEWLVNITDDAWFGTSAGPYQYMQIARVRAIEQGVPLVRSSNTGLSAVFDPLGRELARLDLEKTTILDLYLPYPLHARTVFSRYPYMSLLLIVFISVIFSANRFIVRKKSP